MRIKVPFILAVLATAQKLIANDWYHVYRFTDISRRPSTVWGIGLMIVSSLILYSGTRPATADAAPPIDYSRLAEWKSVDTGAPVISVAFSPDDSMVAGGLDGKIEIYNDKLELIKELVASENKKASSEIQPLGGSPTDHRWMMRLTFSPDSKLIAAACYDGTVRIWDVKTGAETICNDPKLTHDKWTLHSHKGPVRSIAFSPDGSKIVSGGDDKAVKEWDVKSGKLLWDGEGNDFRVVAVTFSSDGSSAISIGARDTGHRYDLQTQWNQSGEFRTWDANTGQLEQSTNVDGFDSFEAAVSPDGKLAICTGVPALNDEPDPISVWDVKTGIRVYSDGKLRGVSAINSFSPDSTIIVQCRTNNDGAPSYVSFLSAQDGQYLIHKYSKDSPVFIPAGAYLSVPSAVFSVAITKGNRAFAFGCKDGTIQIWQVP